MVNSSLICNPNRVWQRAAVSQAQDTARVIQESVKKNFLLHCATREVDPVGAGSDRRPLATGGVRCLAEVLLAGGWIPYQVETSAFGVKYIRGDVIHCK